ncbi:MAG: phage holin family protein [Candidatus Saccharibacteria bacterium]|nr:phage holin family protein [Candidatus Saccharibacteria bacterium]
MNNKFVIFVVRWLFNSLGLWIAVRLFGTGYDSSQVSISIVGFLLAGLIFSMVNAVLKPFIVILALPAILVTLGLFIIIVNGLMVWISLRFVPSIEMTFFNSILTGIILSLVNYIVSASLVLRKSEAN